MTGNWYDCDLFPNVNDYSVLLALLLPASCLENAHNALRAKGVKLGNIFNGHGQSNQYSIVNDIDPTMAGRITIFPKNIDIIM